MLDRVRMERGYYRARWALTVVDVELVSKRDVRRTWRVV